MERRTRIGRRSRCPGPSRSLRRRPVARAKTAPNAGRASCRGVAPRRGVYARCRASCPAPASFRRRCFAGSPAADPQCLRPRRCPRSAYSSVPVIEAPTQARRDPSDDHRPGWSCGWNLPTARPFSPRVRSATRTGEPARHAGRQPRTRRSTQPCSTRERRASRPPSRWWSDSTCGAR